MKLNKHVLQKFKRNLSIQKYAFLLKVYLKNLY